MIRQKAASEPARKNDINGSLKSPLVLVRVDHVASCIVTAINGLKKRVWADLFVTLGFDSLSQIAMSSALRVFTRGMFGFAEIIVVVTLVCLLAAIALLNSFALRRVPERTALRPHQARHIGKTTGQCITD
jgi:hypothetical protein